MKQTYSTKNISQVLLNEIKDALKNVTEYGSIEIYIQGGCVTQITTRKIKKTNGYGLKNHENMTNNGHKKDLS
ncbi:MAG: hypothetical protein US62_C0004G0021 [Candidatus Woesebacteria bacterium GW2011_GWA1_37_8]|uniref:DUF2292 domain-containing protein n=2 Tax=Candidatus Woeseibacteriota TaxID=1752722 RepID=A0A0G0NP25_9BACT|nr:MAG: hypothetical protein US39_C0005G0005 [Microgenomates group bacterium GW2011_GWC1_37_12b]KKQ46208.1 MAG: hypothetical protein US62_C0004G0021 [Candidatus Woesebacteria bacterium GW2011_GWA1_37_8]KKQ87619.1 MAG: hypothetical protein UT10_C0003G0023 [Candidatus Woesebacteria bacterium GW2011_GWB1_38_8b]